MVYSRVDKYADPSCNISSRLSDARWEGITKDSPEHGKHFLWTFIVHGVGRHMMVCYGAPNKFQH
jgi:hypothetical protein